MKNVMKTKEKLQREKERKKRKKAREEAALGESPTADDVEEVAELKMNDDKEKNEEKQVEEISKKEDEIKPKSSSKAKNKKKNKGAEPKKDEKPSSTVPVQSKCKICGLDFESRSQLFRHIEATGHARLKTENSNQKPNSKKKGKK
jgi:DnaJ family protein A protein 5